MMKLAKNAQIIILDDNGQKKDTIDVMFNPSDYSYSIEAKYNNAQQGQPVFNKFEFQPFTVSLFYDTYEEGTDVRDEYTAKIADLVNPTVPAKDVMIQPEIIFSWGSFNIRGKVQKVEQKFTMFLHDGTPVRVQVTIVIVPTATMKKVEELLGRNACRKLWTVKMGDRLDLIAAKALKDPSLWRKIAVANQIANPLGFPTEKDIGQTIIIPD